VALALDPTSRVIGNPYRLFENQDISFQGSIVLGLGFTMAPEEAHALTDADQRNAEVLQPYLNGEDLNQRPNSSARRWVINFRDWPEERARSYPRVWDIIEREVQPERQRRKPDGSYVLRKPLPQRYWHYADKRPKLYSEIRGMGRVIVITLHSKVVVPQFVSTGQVFSHALGVFVTDDAAMLALLSSSAHYWWAIERSSTLETRIRYTPSDVFETFARPKLTADLRWLGERLDTYRRALMLARQAGLTATYNLVHDPACTDTDIAELRRIHVAIDEEVMRAYGWTDLNLDHGFHDTRQGTRYTVGPAARQEILDRLLELNHKRYAEEQAKGLHDKTKTKRTTVQEGLF
jgi:MmeI, target recognition domain